MVWKLQRSLPVSRSKARMSPGALGSCSGTVLPMISMSSNTTPGVLALTEISFAGRPNPSRKSTQPLSLPQPGIGLPVVRSSANSLYR